MRRLVDLVGVLAFPAVALFSGCGTSEQPTDVTNVTQVDGGPSADAGTCAPKSCVQVGANCGTASDGCVGVLDCGQCATGLTCGGGGPNKCGSASCTPKTCVQLGASCGLLSDGCSEAISCGTCEDGQVCGGGGVPNHCACVPTVSCSSAGADCGNLEDGCGTTLQCGTCGPGQVCGTGGPNRCGPEPCTPAMCSDYGYLCGVMADGCGGSVNCGTCGPAKTCHQHTCCVAGVTQSCTKTCQELLTPVTGYSQFESVWCVSADKSLASVVNCSEPDPDPCTTNGQPPGCGLVPGFRWCEVTCYRYFDCAGTIQCDGPCA